jgi:hypothetical protein
MADSKTSETPVMSTEVTEPVATAVEPTEDPTAELGADGKPFDAKRAQELIDKLRDENKKLKPKAKRADELEQAEADRKKAEMTDLEKAQLLAKETSDKLQALELKETQRSAATKVGLPPEFAERLRGTTPEELEADAKLLLAAIPKKPIAQTNTTNPGDTTATETDAMKRKRLGLA